MQENGLTRIYFKEILPRINKKDKRSVNNWCRKNNVEIFKDCSGEFVIQAEFEQAINRPIVTRFKQKYGENWVQVYELAKENKLYLVEENNKEVWSSNNYKPQSQASIDFLKEFD